MKITKKPYNLKAGTLIEHKDGYIVLASDYDGRGWYDSHDVETTDDGDLYDTGSGHFVTPSDLVGDYIIGTLEVKE